MGLAILTLRYGSVKFRFPERTMLQRIEANSDGFHPSSAKVFGPVQSWQESGHVHTAVDVQDMACDVSRFIGRKKTDPVCDLTVCSHSACRNNCQKLFTHVLRQPFRHRGCDEPRCDGIYRDIPSGDL